MRREKTGLMSIVRCMLICSILQGGPLLASLDTLSDVRVLPLVKSKWAKSTGCSWYAPEQAPAGCIAVSMSQVMHYHEFPVIGIGRHQFDIWVDDRKQLAFTRGGDGNGGPYQWKLMLEGTCSCRFPDNKRWPQAVSALTYDAGLSVGTRYSTQGLASGAHSEALRYALVNTFGYSSAKRGGTDNLVETINSNLDAGYPVILTVGGAGAHSLICDGYGYDGSLMYHHLNMNRDGKHDAWYNLDILDVPNYRGDAFYTLINTCIYNVFPSGTGEIISGRAVDELGRGLQNATVIATGPDGAYQTRTGHKGIYSFPQVMSDAKYTIQVGKPGYISSSQTVHTGTSIDDANEANSSGNRWGINLTLYSALAGEKFPRVINDFESINEINELQDYWVDSSRKPSTGETSSVTIGHSLSELTRNKDSLETRIVNSGDQSLPIFYNTQSGTCEATRNLWQADAQNSLGDWTLEDASTLSLWFRGCPPMDYPERGSFVWQPSPSGGQDESTLKQISISGTSKGINRWTDEFQYAGLRLSIPGSILVKIEEVSSANGWAKVGLMARDTLDPEARMAALFVTPEYGCFTHMRRAWDHSTIDDTGIRTNAQEELRAPCYMKLDAWQDSKGRNVFNFLYSWDNENWKSAPWWDWRRPEWKQPASKEMYIGLAVTSSDPMATCGATYTILETTGELSSEWTCRDIGPWRNDSLPMYIRVSDISGKEAIVYYEDPNATQIETWTQWIINLQDLADQGVDLTDIAKLSIGFGDGMTNGGSGLVYIDDIRLSNTVTMPLEMDPPLIQHDPIAMAQPDLPVTFYATVTDQTDVASVVLRYRRIGRTRFQSRPMTHTLNNRYSVTLEGVLAAAPGLEYYIEASDGTRTATQGSSGNPHVIQVDFVGAPEIVHEPPTDVEIGQPLSICAEITDDEQIQSAQVFYRTLGAVDYQGLPMQNSSDDSYCLTLPGILVVPPGLGYYIEAHDKNSSVCHGSPDSPHRIHMVDGIAQVMLDNTSDATQDSDDVMGNCLALCQDFQATFNAEAGSRLEVTFLVDETLSSHSIFIAPYDEGNDWVDYAKPISTTIQTNAGSGGLDEAITATVTLTSPILSGTRYAVCLDPSSYVNVKLIKSASSIDGRSSKFLPGTLPGPKVARDTDFRIKIAIRAHDNHGTLNVTHDPIIESREGLPLRVRAEISGATRLQSVKIYCRVIGQVDFQEKVMLVTSGDEYKTTLPKASVVAPGLEYYIEAIDQNNTVYHGSPDFPHCIAIEEAAEQDLIIYDDSLAPGWSAVGIGDSVLSLDNSVPVYAGHYSIKCAGQGGTFRLSTDAPFYAGDYEAAEFFVQGSVGGERLEFAMYPAGGGEYGRMLKERHVQGGSISNSEWRKVRFTLDDLGVPESARIERFVIKYFDTTTMYFDNFMFTQGHQ